MATTTYTYANYRTALRAGVDPDDIRGAHRTLGDIAFWTPRIDRDDASLHDLPGWPECECCGCGCTEPATTTDSGVPVCETCSHYTIDDEGDVHCIQMGDVEQVTESCGAGGQTRTYYRLMPPEMPDTDPDGEWAVWWETVGDDAHLVARYATRALAEQAITAHDWPRPGDHTHYLCGYGIRRLVDSQWARNWDEYDGE